MVREVATHPASDATRRRYFIVSAAALIGLASIGFVLLTPTLPEAPAPEAERSSEPLAEPGLEAPPVIDPIVVEISEPIPDPIVVEISEPIPDPVGVEIFEPVQAPDPVAVDVVEPAPDPVAVEIIEPPPDRAVVEMFEPVPDPVAVDVIEPSPDPAIVEIFEPVPDPVELAPIKPASTPQVTPTAAVTASVPSKQTIDSLPNASVAAELEQFRETTEALEAELARRDLFAAELALELGRLVEPPQESAYTLYNRVLTRYPDSPEAKAGLQSVRQGLINRTLAQLAGNELDSARSSLQAAEDAGVNPQLIADLRGEIEYRQQLIGE